MSTVAQGAELFRARNSVSNLAASNVPAPAIVRHRQDPVSSRGHVWFTSGQRIASLEIVRRLQRFASYLKSHGRPARATAVQWRWIRWGMCV